MPAVVVVGPSIRRKFWSFSVFLWNSSLYFSYYSKCISLEMYSSDSNMWRQRWWSGLRACRPHEKVPLLLLHPISVLYLYWNSFVSVLYLFCICIIIVLYLCYIFFIFVLYLYCIAWESAAPPPSFPFHYFLSVLHLCCICFVFVLYLFSICIIIFCICVVSVSYCIPSSLTFLSNAAISAGSMTLEIWLHFSRNMALKTSQSLN